MKKSRASLFFINAKEVTVKGVLWRFGGMVITGLIFGMFEYFGNEAGKQAYDYFKKNFDFDI